MEALSTILYIILHKKRDEARDAIEVSLREINLGEKTD